MTTHMTHSLTSVVCYVPVQLLLPLKTCDSGQDGHPYRKCHVAVTADCHLASSDHCPFYLPHVRIFLNIHWSVSEMDHAGTMCPIVATFEVDQGEPF